MSALVRCIWVILALLCSRFITKAKTTTGTKRKKYLYSPLSPAPRTIRLLKVLPKSGDITHISLKEAHLDNVNGQYDAISYVWGNPMPHRYVVVDGKKLKVRNNIYQCLKHLRQHRMISNPLWIDCICINQADTAEKEQQIANMSRIFSSAKTVYVWLGKTSRRFRSRRKYSHALLRNVLKDSQRKELLQTLIQRQALISPDPISLEVTDQLMRLVYDEYWYRLWIVQEIALASDARVVVGDMLINAETYLDVYIAVRAASKPAYYIWLRRQNNSNFEDRGTRILDNHPILDMRRLSDDYDDPEETGLAKLIEFHRRKLCSDPRDRVYGLLGLTSSCHHPPIDYRCSVEVLLLRTMESLIAEAEDILSQDSDDFDVQVPKFDSWVIACVMQSLETTSEKVMSAITTSSALAQEYTRIFEVMIQAHEVVLPCTRAPEDQTVLEEECTSIQTPSGLTEHFRKRWAGFGRHREQRFQVKETGVPLLICSVGRYPSLLLSINTRQQVAVERLLAYDTSRTIHQSVELKSRHVPPKLRQNLNTKLNSLNIDWQDIFTGKYFNTRVPLSGLELVELAETWDLHATGHSLHDRDEDWKMAWEVAGRGPLVDTMAPHLRGQLLRVRRAARESYQAILDSEIQSAAV